MRIHHVHGLAEDFFDARYTSAWQGDLGVHGCVGVGLNSITAMSGMPGRQIAMNTAVVAQHSGEASTQPIGAGYRPVIPPRWLRSIRMPTFRVSWRLLARPSDPRT